jgi:hypothetical protein
VADGFAGVELANSGNCTCGALGSKNSASGGGSLIGRPVSVTYAP